MLTVEVSNMAFHKGHKLYHTSASPHHNLPRRMALVVAPEPAAYQFLWREERERSSGWQEVSKERRGKEDQEGGKINRDLEKNPSSLYAAAYTVEGPDSTKHFSMC